MTTVIGAHDYFLRGSWGARAETPEAIADRFLHYIDALGSIHPLFGRWISGANGPKKLETIRENFAQEVAARVATDDFNKPDPIYGYFIGAYTREQPDARCYAFRINAGANLPTIEHQNQALLVTSSRGVPDPAVITYPVFRSAMMAMIEIWEPVDCRALSDELLDAIDWSHYFHAAWIQYLSAPLAKFVIPPQTAMIEHLPNGGLLMSATDQTFKVENPAHMAVARDIAAAIAPLNTLPYAGNRPSKQR